MSFHCVPNKYRTSTAVVFRLFSLQVLLLVVFSKSVWTNNVESQLQHIKSKTPREQQICAVNALFRRVLQNRSEQFIPELSYDIGPPNRDTFRIESLDNGKIKITGSSAIAITTGLNHYLKYYCHRQISWEVPAITLPVTLPEVNESQTLTDRFRYYQNVCTSSYSFAWWDWLKWEQHIDWIALNSYNLVLAFNGQEAIWERIYSNLNLTRKEIEEHFGGPAFLAWSRMGNIRGWGGPLTKNWHDHSLYLQKKIVKRMRELGIITVLPAFAGHVPISFKRLYPDVKMYQMKTWNQFNETYCCPFLLDPTEPLFKLIGKIFIKELISEFGTDHIYNCDTFNEMEPFTNNITYLDEIGKSIYASMTEADPDAIWMLQGWMFYSELEFWDRNLVQAFVQSIPLGKMIVLDLQSEQFPQYGRLKSYFGQPYIWCMLHNFGGTLGLFGSVDIINTRVFEARLEHPTTLIGTGITPEGINQNYIVYDLMSEMAWRKEPANLTEWTRQYTVRRYGTHVDDAVKAWDLLMNSVYNYKGLTKMRGKYAMNKSPSTKIKIWSWYNNCDLFEAWDLLLQCGEILRSQSAYLHDIVDVTRQVLQVLGDQYYVDMINAFKNKDVHAFNQISEDFLALFPDMESILASNANFLLGNWLESAKALAGDEKEKDLLEYNARNQITLWGPNGEILDYASKQWSGVVADFFEPRWTLFIKYMNQSLVKQVPFRESRVSGVVFKRIEETFTFEKKVYSTEPRGNTMEIAKKIHEKWLVSGHYRVERSKKFQPNTIEENSLHNDVNVIQT